MNGEIYMILLQASDIARYFGGDTLFNQVSITIKDHARIGLVGRNGAGKSTLLHILAGLEEPDEGQVSCRKNVTIGFLDQHTGLESNRTIMEEMTSVFQHIIDLEHQLLETEHQISQINPQSSQYQTIINQYDTLQERFKQLDGYSYQSDIRTVLHGFRFFENDYNTPIQTLSGGQKTRLALAKLLLEKKDLLILDEPTNHLDIDTLAWLETFLHNYKGALLVVSHDRYFLDHIIQEVYEIHRHGVYQFPGNYSNYLTLKADQMQQQWKQYEKQQQTIQSLESFIEKNIVRASTTKRAQSRRKQLDKIDRLEKPMDTDKSAVFSFKIRQRSGQQVMNADNMTIGYEAANPLAQNINIDIRHGERIALVGPNGVGKTTLLKTITNQIPPLLGNITLGTNVSIGYYDQEQQHLHHQKSILMELWDDFPTIDEETIRSLLGSFLFSGDAVQKHIHTLSGGERARVALAKLALEQNNYLILDEPTNHLDINSKEVLENALIDFKGTICFVSHDRYFINRIATKIIELSNTGATVYLGDYDDYIAKKETLSTPRANDSNLSDISSNNSSAITEATRDRQTLKQHQTEQRKLIRRSDAIETQLTDLDTALADIAEQLSDPTVYENPSKLQRLTDETLKLEQKQLDLMTEWESIQDRLT